MGGGDISERGWAEKAVAETLLHVVVATAVVNHIRIDSQLLVLIFSRGNRGNRRAEFRASGQQGRRTETERH